MERQSQASQQSRKDHQWKRLEKRVRSVHAASQRHHSNLHRVHLRQEFVFPIDSSLAIRGQRTFPIAREHDEQDLWQSTNRCRCGGVRPCARLLQRAKNFSRGEFQDEGRHRDLLSPSNLKSDAFPANSLRQPTTRDSISLALG